MTILLLLIPLALGLGTASVLAFFWAIQNGQYEDADGAAARILLDDDLHRDNDRAST